MLPPTPVRLVAARATTDTALYPSTTGSNNQFLNLLSTSFQSSFIQSSTVSSIVFSLSFSILLTIIFSLLRPHHNVVYAPRAKYADSKHAPPTIPRGVFAWIRTITRVREPELVDKLGLDAALFMRFVRMMRNIFSILTIVGCGVLIPTNLIKSSSSEFSSTFLGRLGPSLVFGDILWLYVVLAYVFNGVILYFLWRNYRAVFNLRRQHFTSAEYQRSLHSRTLMLTDIPRDFRTDEGIVRIVQQAHTTRDTPRASIARNVKDLPDLVERHEEAVRNLEKVLAKYLKNPNRLPSSRPKCRASHNIKGFTKGQTVDAIEYYTALIRSLEIEIRDVRQSVDRRDPMPYGFASYPDIAEAHSVAYAARKKGPEGTNIRQAPKPNDLIWKNLPLSKKTRDWQNFINNLWIALLTLVWIVPNVLIAVFLTNLAHLGAVWPAFQTSLETHHVLWSLVQGILAPAITTAVYIILPKIFRRLVTRAGDTSRTSRERHVMHKLFSFFLFNNLVVFSLFSAVWAYVVDVINVSKTSGQSTWDALKAAHPFNLIIFALITVSTYWLIWLLQRNLGSAIDLSQVVTLLWGSIQRRFFSPTPRDIIELTAPQPFDYASYYNYLLFYTAVTLCFSFMQPLVLPVTALYFWMDSFSKKYMLLYIFITKYESGGMIWRSLVNRILASTMIANVVIAMLVVVKSYNDWAMLAAMAPLPIILIAFKVYCLRTLDGPIHFYSEGTDVERTPGTAADHKRNHGDRIAVRYGNPLLYKKLITPMVAAKSQHLLKEVYSGRTDMDEDGVTTGYSEIYMDSMDQAKLGKTKEFNAPFEFVDENHLDYSHWKDDAHFAAVGGGDGALFGQSSDMTSTRPSTPSTLVAGGLPHTRTWDSRASSPRHSRIASAESELGQKGFTEVQGVDYPRGYHPTPSAALREQSPAGSDSSFGRVALGSRGRDAPYSGMQHQPDSERLMSHAARMGRSTPGAQTPGSAFPTPSAYGYIRNGIGEDYAASTPGEEETSYDYFRSGRSRG